MVDVDDFVPITKASRLVPGNPHTSTLIRWSQHGVLAADGNRVKLETTKVGGRLFTSGQAIDAFLAATNGDCEPKETADDVKRRSREARAALEKLGV